MTNFDSKEFFERCKEAQIKAGTYHPDLEAILPVLWDGIEASVQHNNASVHGYILRERERCAMIAEEMEYRSESVKRWGAESPIAARIRSGK